MQAKVLRCRQRLNDRLSCHRSPISLLVPSGGRVKLRQNALARVVPILFHCKPGLDRVRLADGDVFFQNRHLRSLQVAEMKLLTCEQGAVDSSFPLRQGNPLMDGQQED